MRNAVVGERMGEFITADSHQFPRWCHYHVSDIATRNYTNLQQEQKAS